MTAQQNMPPFLDEFGFYLDSQDDPLKEDLRTIVGVPNASYLVRDGRVFVFDKLVQLVKQNRTRASDVPLSDFAPSLVPEATVSADEAVGTWGVVPEPYEKTAAPGGGSMIRHRPFNARLPGTFQREAELQDALANVLLGGIQTGEGEFTYRGQPMSLCEPLDPETLPPRPVFQGLNVAGGLGFTALSSVNYKSGFEPVSESLFDRVKGQEATWKNDCAYAAQHAQEHASDLWALAATFPLGKLDDLKHEELLSGLPEVTELQQLYPELAMLSGGSLFAWFSVYQQDCCFVTDGGAHRDDGFLFYLLGKVADRRPGWGTEKEVGQWVGYAILRGVSPDDAFAFGRAANLYDNAISCLARRIADAMQFLAQDEISTRLQGKGITTVLDMFRLGTSSGFTAGGASRRH